MFYRLSKALWVLLFLVSNSVFAYAPEEIGFILMHGKWAAPAGPLANDYRIKVMSAFIMGG